MGLGGGVDLIGEGEGEGDSEGFASSAVSCSICLEAVKDDGERSLAKLRCGHQFHLDCIGSAFNVKGVMQCPNCRKIEKGQWHYYASSCHPFSEFSMDDWTRDEDLYDLSYSEMTFGIHWCPFSGGLTRLPLPFEDGDLSSAAYHDLLRQHAIFAEQTAVSSATHPCPYVAYFGPVHPSSSNSSGSVSDVPNFNNHWNGPSVPSDIPTSYPFPAMDIHYQSWEHHSLPFSTTGSSRINGADQPSIPSVTQRLGRGNSDVPRSGAYVHPFVVGHHNSGARAGSSVPSAIPSYPGSSARARDRVQALQAYYQQQPSNSPAMRGPVISGTRRSNNHRNNMAQVRPVASSSGRTGGAFYFFPSGTSSRNFQEPDIPMSTRLRSWERDHFHSFPSSLPDRDSAWGTFHQAAAGSDSSIRPSSHRQRHGSERASQHWS